MSYHRPRCSQALIQKIQAQLSVDDFASFRAESARFMRGALSADAYHATVADLGLLGVVGDLAATCPDAEQRRALLNAHMQHAQNPAPGPCMAKVGEDALTEILWRRK